MINRIKTRVEKTIEVFNEAEAHAGDMEFVNFELCILGESIRLHIGVADREAKLADIVPLARVISSKITDIIVEKKRREGINITCRKGCSNCCIRHLVPMSIPETIKLAEEIFSRPEQQRNQMLRSCILAARCILKHKPPEVFSSLTTPGSPDNQAVLQELSSWYANLRVACPFLSKGICDIYENRPLACREYFVIDSPQSCMGYNAMAKRVDVPVPMIEVLGQLAGELEGTDIEAVLLPLMPAWYKLNPDRSKRTWPAAMMVERFIEITKSMIQKPNPIPIVAASKKSTTNIKTLSPLCC